MARYGLARHVFVCADEEYVVVLDVKQDRYFTLEAARTAPLGPLLPGWPAPPAGGSSGDGPELTADEAAAPLLRHKGVQVTKRSTGTQRMILLTVLTGQ